MINKVTIRQETHEERTETRACDLISRQAAIDKFIDALEEIFSDIRERRVDDSVCGLCEYDGAYIGQSGDWCNECPGFDRDDCFKLSDKIRKEWTDEIIKALTSAQPKQRWIPVSERLPEDFKKVLVFWWEHSEPMIDTAFWQKDAKRFDGQHWVRIEDKITHWMPLPEPARLEND